ncbi:MAG: protein-export chaperone SecB [Rickettsiales bacterium]|jgi:preprotein translocase subunit SecB|nr:protein-export chaperone SecB [Rickettsiales bacterium]
MENHNDRKSDFEILNQYIKDLSFESPSSPRIFFEKAEGAPKVDLNMEVRPVKIGDELYDIALHFKIASSLADKPLFVIELVYGAVAAVHITDEAALKSALTKSIPQQMYPFIRSIVAEITKDSGFSPFILNPINFDTIELK